MSRPHPLNQAVISQVLDDLRHGQLRKARAMGFEDEDLGVIVQADNASFLSSTFVSWCSVFVNVPVMRALLHQTKENAREIEETEHLLRLGASSRIVAQYHGLTNQEIALRRNLIGITAKKGRPENLTPEESDTLWHRYMELRNQSKTGPDDEQAMLAHAKELAESMGHSLAIIWRILCDWHNEGLI
jgi:hypothetical protein